MTENDGLRLVIQLDANEAATFRRLAKTDDESLYEGIAKTLVLGAGEVVDPQEVFESIKLLLALVGYGRQIDLRAKQEWADELSFTREQLESLEVRNAVKSWAIYYSDEIDELAEGRFAPHTDRVGWATLNITASGMLSSLRATINGRLAANRSA